MADALGIASSSTLDGRTFNYDAESASPVLVGDLLTLRTEGETSLLVQIMTKERAEEKNRAGHRRRIGKLENGALLPPDARPFRTATIGRATPGMLDPLVSRRGPVARVGTTRTGELPALPFANSSTGSCSSSAGSDNDPAQDGWRSLRRSRRNRDQSQERRTPIRRNPKTELRTLRFSLVDDLRTSCLAQRTAPESF
jgi:hypothetical protein